MSALRTLAIVLALSSTLVARATAQPLASPSFVAGAVPRGLDSLEAAACGECHREQYDEWRSSAHRRAWTDPLLARELRGRREAFCDGCHAPRAPDPRAPGGAALASDGVDCATCHVRDGAIRASHVSGRAPHASRVDPELSGTGACAECHQFDFPNHPGMPMQDTVAESSNADHAAGQTCIDCHAPRTDDGRHRHDYPGARDEALLARALDVDVRAVRDGWTTRVELTLRGRDVAHAVPTGDIFRRLDVRAWIAGRPDTSRNVLLGRVLRADRTGWRVLRDDRVPPPGRGTRVVELRLPGRGELVAWQIDLWRIAPERMAPGELVETEVRARVTSGTERVDAQPQLRPVPRR